MKLPALFDPHIHTREPGATHKEDWDSATSAALAGGFTQVFAMPNTTPPVHNATTLAMALNTAAKGARCDYAQFMGAGAGNVAQIQPLAAYCAGLKVYLDQTFGDLRLNDMTEWLAHFNAWQQKPIVAHAEGRSLAAAILLAAIAKRPLHLAHVARREDILIIRAAKEQGYAITCEVTPHHLFLTADDLPAGGRAEVRPSLGTAQDVAALWENMAVIDCFATDHAPHTLAEKDSENPPPGFPGLETALPLFLNAIAEGRLSMSDFILRAANHPRKIMGIAAQPETWMEVDEDITWRIGDDAWFSRAGWSPFEGMKVKGKLRNVVSRGKTVFSEGRVLALPGSARHIFPPLDKKYLEIA